MNVPKPHFLLYSECRWEEAESNDDLQEPWEDGDAQETSWIDPVGAGDSDRAAATNHKGCLANGARRQPAGYDDGPSHIGHWRFVIAPADGGSTIEITDMEPGVYGERLELLTVVRALEALDQPSRITLVTGSRYVVRGIRFGLAEWRAADWHWERFGELTPVKHDDLWRRVDHALKYHDVECRNGNLSACEPSAGTTFRLGGDEREYRIDPPHTGHESHSSATARRRPGRRPKRALA